jgi:hypothetical protein
MDPRAAPNGGYRTGAANSDCHAARPAFRNVSDLIDSGCAGNRRFAAIQRSTSIPVTLSGKSFRSRQAQSLNAYPLTARD